MRYGSPLKPGRPRERWHVADYRQRIDSNELRRDAIRRDDPIDRPRRLIVQHGRNGLERTDEAAIVARPDRFYGWRWWLICPCCASRRVHLYHVHSGVKCLSCAGIVYADRR